LKSPKSWIVFSRVFSDTKEQWEEVEADHQQLVLQLQAVELHLTFGTSREQAPHRWFEEISLTTTSSC